MAKRSKQKSEKKRIPFSVPIIGDEDVPRARDAIVLPVDVAFDEPAYDPFLAERDRAVDARQRAQQRMGQIVAAGAVGALVLSIALVNDVAAAPAARTAGWLIAGWAALVVALGCALAHHSLGQTSSAAYIRELDRAYRTGEAARPRRLGARLASVASLALVAGLACLAVFAFRNLAIA